MNRRVFVFSMFALATKLSTPLTTLGLNGSFEPDLSGVAQGKGWRAG